MLAGGELVDDEVPLFFTYAQFFPLIFPLYGMFFWIANFWCSLTNFVELVSLSPLILKEREDRQIHLKIMNMFGG